MVYYIRFVKVPEVIKSNPKSAAAASVRCMFDIRNDLAEMLSANSIAVQATLFDAESKSCINYAGTNWNGNQWSEEATLNIPSSFRGRCAILRLSARQAEFSKVQGASPLLMVASVQSSPFSVSPGQKADEMAQRLIFAPSGYPMPAPWERVGSTIFGHVWDAGAVLAAHLVEMALSQTNDSRPSIDSPLSRMLLTAGAAAQNVEIIELGSGTGTVSLSVAQNFQNCRVTPTDTETALPLLQKNVREAHESLSLRSILQNPLALDWDQPEHHGWLDKTEWNLILISDCTYNSASATSLVRTIARIARAEDTLVAVALKRRHQDEAIFYELMEKADYRVIHHHVFSIPDQSRIDAGFAEEEVELYQYALRSS